MKYTSAPYYSKKMIYESNPNSPSRYYSNNNYGNNSQNSELRFTLDHENRIKSYQDYLQQKCERIDTNASNYLNFISNDINSKKNLKNMTKSSSVAYTPVNVQQGQGQGQSLGLGIGLGLAQSNHYTKINPYPLTNNQEDRRSSFVPGFIKSKGSDITNMNYFTNDQKDFIKRKQREYLMYNQNTGFINGRRRHENDYNTNPNPYNQRTSEPLGVSSLTHNTILNPVPDFAYNKYITKSTLVTAGQNIL